MCQLRKSEGLDFNKLDRYMKNKDYRNKLAFDIRNKYGDYYTNQYFTVVNEDKIALSYKGFLVSNSIISDI